MILISFIVFLILFVVIGVISITKSKSTTEDYLIAEKSVPPSLAGLSAIATNASGFMFIGMIGVVYTSGLSSVWFMIGWITGDVLASFFTVNKIQQASRPDHIQSYGSLLASWYGTYFKKLQILVGLLTVFFLIFYAAAQLKAGSKATSSILGWSPQMGVLISALIVLLYSVVGGIRASIWTDVAQSLVMVVGMLLLVIMGVHYFGGIEFTLAQLSQVSPIYLDWFPDKSVFHFILFLIGMVVAGFTVIGQPHIVIRFMSLNKAESLTRMRCFYYGWYSVFFAATIVVGMLARIIIPEVDGFDAEIALPHMATTLLPEILVGLILAALFAAAMSTADSQILACSAAITNDVMQNSSKSLWIAKLTTFIVLIAAVVIALSNTENVFTLVLDAWGMLAAAFTPLIVLYSMNRKVSEWPAIAMLIVGPVVFVLWNSAGLDEYIYAVVPGIIAGILVYLVSCGLKSN